MRWTHAQYSNGCIASRRYSLLSTRCSKQGRLTPGLQFGLVCVNTWAERTPTGSLRKGLIALKSYILQDRIPIDRTEQNPFLMLNIYPRLESILKNADTILSIKATAFLWTPTRRTACTQFAPVPLRPAAPSTENLTSAAGKRPPSPGGILEGGILAKPTAAPFAMEGLRQAWISGRAVEGSGSWCLGTAQSTPTPTPKDD